MALLPAEKLEGLRQRVAGALQQAAPREPAPHVQGKAYVPASPGTMLLMHAYTHHLPPKTCSMLPMRNHT